MLQAPVMLACSHRTGRLLDEDEPELALEWLGPGTAASPYLVEPEWVTDHMSTQVSTRFPEMLEPKVQYLSSQNSGKTTRAKFSRCHREKPLGFLQAARWRLPC
jgi:hypothetical protein